MAALTTLNITEKNANNSLSVTVKVNVTKEGVFTTTLSKEDVDKIHSYGIKLPTNRLGNEGYFNSIVLSDLESQIREVLKRCLSYKIVKEVPVIKYQLETNCMFSYDKNGNIVPNPSKEWTGANEIKDRVLKYVYNIKQERSYNNDLVGIFERYKDIADGDMEVAMNFIKEAYPFNEETESFIRKKFDMPIPDESKEQ